MNIKNIKFRFIKTFLLLLAISLSINAVGQTCDFSLNNSGNTGGFIEYYLVLDAAGNVAQVVPGPGPVSVTGQGLGTVTEVIHLMYDPTDPPVNVPPAVGDDPNNITGGCTNNFLGAGILLECLCEEDEIAVGYTPGGGDALMYYLVDGAGTVLDVNTTGNFGMDETVGDYFVYALAYDTTDPPTTIPGIGDNISTFSNDGCYNQDFLSSGCCAQKISCCALEAELDLAATTCDAPNGNLVFEIDVTMATGTITGDNGATFTDNGGGSWTGLVTVTPGSMVTVTVTDGTAMCSQEVIIDATYITCDDTGNPVCSLMASLDTNINSFVCNADGTIDCNIIITGAAGTNVTIDGTLAGGDGTYPATLNGLMGTVTVLDPDGFDNCQFDLVYDLSTILPDTPPVIAPSTTIQICPFGPIDPAVASGTGGMFEWYADAALTTPATGFITGANNESYTPLSVAMGTTVTVYVVETTSGGCPSASTAVEFIRGQCAANGGSF